jgi:hypothetical protein
MRERLAPRLKATTMREVSTNKFSFWLKIPGGESAVPVKVTKSNDLVAPAQVGFHLIAAEVSGINLHCMNKGMSVALLAVGVLLLIWGVNAMDSFSSDVSRFFTGSPTDKAVWLMIGGIAAAIVGLFGMLRGAKGG